MPGLEVVMTWLVLLLCPGHAYYFLEDVYPRMSGRRPLRTPSLVKAMFPRSDDAQPAIIIQDAIAAAAVPAAPAAATPAAADAAPQEPGLQPEQHHMQVSTCDAYTESCARCGLHFGRLFNIIPCGLCPWEAQLV